MMKASGADAPMTIDPFGIYRAEWLNSALFRLFARPGYFPELETARPCVLIGGRGTGKTTVLKCLSYEGQYELNGQDPATIASWNYVGFYHRTNTNRVTAFQGEELSLAKWTKAFGHYINLLLCGHALTFLEWYHERVPGKPELSAQSCIEISCSLNISDCNSESQLRSAIITSTKRFEQFLNDVDEDSLPPLSVQGQPIDDLCSHILRLPQFGGKSIFFIIDEFENLLDYQQQVLNTLIKHCGSYYTFKIGVRELGWRVRTTHNQNEQLISPADYERIDIAQRLDGDSFSGFAREVCDLRAQQSSDYPADIAGSLPGLSLDEEADLLGVGPRLEELLDQLRCSIAERKLLKALPPLEAYFTCFVAQNENLSAGEVITIRNSDSRKWNERYNNYKYSIMFSIKQGRSGLRKYYSGWETYTRLAGNNIRYLLELITQARILHNREGKLPTEPVSPENQTIAAQLVGKKNLMELEGLSVYGAQLTKLLLSLGRVFEVLAANPTGHAPEVNQFHFPDEAPLGDAEKILTAATMHLALVRSVANKRQEYDLKSFDYSIHPIFSPFFGYSHRRKRKMRITPRLFMLLIESPRDAIRQSLKLKHIDSETPLSQQLSLFENFYR
jgi:hypothetical protein